MCAEALHGYPCTLHFYELRDVLGFEMCVCYMSDLNLSLRCASSVTGRSSDGFIAAAGSSKTAGRLGGLV